MEIRPWHAAIITVPNNERVLAMTRELIGKDLEASVHPPSNPKGGRPPMGKKIAVAMESTGGSASSSSSSSSPPRKKSRVYNNKPPVWQLGAYTSVHRLAAEEGLPSLATVYGCPYDPKWCTSIGSSLLAMVSIGNIMFGSVSDGISLMCV